MLHLYFWAARISRLGNRFLLAGLLLLGSTAARAQLSGTYYVGTGASPDATRTYATLPAAMTALGTGVTAGASVTFTLLDATYALGATSLTVPAPALSAGQSISIVPAAGVSPVISGSSTTGLIILDGTDYLTINGNDGSGGRAISLRNTASGPAVLLRNDATYNALRYVSLESSNTSTSSGTVFFGTTTGTTGNDFNTLANCEVKDGTAVPAYAVFSLGTGAAVSSVPAVTANSDNTVQNCVLYNFTAGGVYLNDTGSGGNWTVSGNNLYQTATRAASGIRTIRVTSGSGHVVTNNNIYQQAGTLTSVFYGIVVVGGATGATITGNVIGGSTNATPAGGAAMAFTGTGLVYPFYLSLGTSAVSSIQGNTVRNISSASTGTAYGFDLAAGAANVGTVTPNTIGSTTAGQGISNAGPLYGIHVESAATATVQGNTFAGLSTTSGLLAGVYLSGSGASSVSGNTISGLASNLTTAAVLAGINSTGTGVVTITNNTLSDLSQSGLTSNLYGIQSNGVAGSNVTGNTITNVTYSGTTAGNTAYGIFASGSNTISNNTITTVQATGSSKTQLRGIYVGGAGATPTVTGNTVSGVLNATTGSAVSTAGIYVGPTSGALGAATVRGNRISNVGTTNTASTTSTHTVVGLLLGSLGTGSVVERNRVWNVYGSTAGTGTNADQVLGLGVQTPNTGFSSAGTFSNNQITLAPGALTQQTYGIQDLSVGGTNNYYYNTVYLAPASAAAGTSYAFWRSEATTPPAVELRDNIFYNDRVAASGSSAFAIGTASTSSWAPASSNYNLFVTPAAAAVGNWGGSSLSFSGWQAAQPGGSGGDANSSFRLNTATPAATLFVDPSTSATTGGNLNINPAYYASATGIESAGVVVAGITTDFDGTDIRQGSPGYSGTGTAPDLGSDEFNVAPPANMTYDPATGTAVTQITGAVPAGSTSQAVIRVVLTTTGPANPISVTQLNFSADGTTANGALPANISNARVYFTGSSGTFATTTPFGTGGVAPAFSAAGGFSVTGSQVLSEGVNYFFLTYDVAAGAPTGNVIDGALTGVKIGSGTVSAIAVATGSPAGNRPILGPMSGSYTVGYDLGTEAYPSLTAAVADLTARGVATGQSVTFRLTNPGATKPYDATTAPATINRETFPIILPAATLSAGQTLSILPATGISPLITDSNPTGVLVLDGTDYLTINGTDGSTSARTITIRNAGSGPAVLLRNDATNNALRYLTLESANTGTTSGTVLFGTTTGTTGNDDNLIANCDVRAANNATTGTDVPANAIYSLGTGAASGSTPVATANSGITVRASNIYNFTAAGVYLNATGSGDSWTVGGPTAADGNSFYNSAARSSQLINIRLGIGNSHVVSNNQIYQTTGTVSATYYGISVVGAGNGSVISNNYVGGAAANAAGNPLSVNGTFYGIFLSVGAGTGTGANAPTSVQGNVVRNISNASTSAETHGIRVDAGLANVGTATGNTVGDANPTAPAVGLVSARNIFGISIYSALASTVSNNTIAGLSYNGSTAGSVVYGVYSLVANSAHTISNNTLTNITATSTTNANLRGIYVGGNGATPTVTGNTVSGVLNATAGGTISTAGIFVGPTGNDVFASVIVSGNTISNVGNTATAAPTGTNQYTTTGLLLGATLAGTIERNRVWNVYGTSAGTSANADQVRGLAVQGTYSGTFANNQISVAAGTTDQQTYGIQDLSSGGTTNFYYNSVYLAPASGAAASSYGFWRSAATAAPAGSLRNNIFYNGRTAASGAAAYAIGTATTTGWTATTSNYNLLVNTDAGAVGNWGGTNLSFAGWKTAQPAGSGGDASSLSITPTAAPAANLFVSTATGNLDINPANPEAWYANGNGVQLTGQTADYGNAATGRSTTVAAGGTDIGSDEFTPTSTPPALTVSAAPVAGGTQVFSLGGRPLATVTYAATGTVPTAVVARYYSGTNPTVPAAITRYPNSYLDVTATGGSGYTYGLVMSYDDALLGTIITEASQHLMKHNPDGTYSFFATTVADAAANTLTTPSLTSFGQLFSTDLANPLATAPGAAAPAALVAFPNPFTTLLTVDVPALVAACTFPLTLTDALGRTVYSKLMTLPAGTKRLVLAELPTLPAGVYLLRVALPGYTQALKVVKQ